MSGDRIGDRYHNETKYTRESLGGGGLNWSGRSEPFKTYPEAIARLKLANPELDRRDNLWHALAERRSRRDYARGSLSFQALSQLVWACQGVTGKVSGYLLRTAPSAGALYLACEAMGLACCGIGAFFDDEVNQVIGVNGKDETAVYMASVGIII
jgi:nitroreductase